MANKSMNVFFIMAYEDIFSEMHVFFRVLQNDTYAGHHILLFANLWHKWVCGMTETGN